MFTEDDLIMRSVVAAKAWNWPNGRPRLCFVFPIQGRGMYSDPQSSRPVAAGDVLVLNTRLPGGLRPLSGSKIRFLYFFAHLEHLATVFTLNEFCLLAKSVKSLANPWYYPATGSLALKCHEILSSVPAELDLEHRCHILKVVGAILAEEFKLSRSRCAGDNLLPAGSSDVLNRLSLEELQNSSIKDLADKYSYSRRHLNRIFHERFGVSLSALKMEMRLLKAVALLRDPGAKLISVAMDCGFNHLSLFSARFRKRFGCSPSQWRDQAFSSPNSIIARSNGSLCPLQARGLCPVPGPGGAAGKFAPEPPEAEIAALKGVTAL